MEVEARSLIDFDCFLFVLGGHEDFSDTIRFIILLWVAC